jgi:hypothetical protein
MAVMAVTGTGGLMTADLYSHPGPLAGNSSDDDRLTVTVPDLVMAPLTRQTAVEADNSSVPQQLLYSDLLHDNLDLDEAMEDADISSYPLNETWSSDSAVSSMASPGQQSFADSSASALTDIDEGASGGMPDKKTPSSNSEQDASNGWHFNDSQLLSLTSAPHRTNHSSKTSKGARQYLSSLPVNTVKNVSHNHNSPPMPGQQLHSKAKEDARQEEERASRSRDEKRAKMLKIPLTMDEIIESSVDHFTELLSEHDLNETQLQLVRDIRRRGKNKLAAQNCRKRKMEVIQTVEEQVTDLQKRRDELLKERSDLDRSTAALKEKFVQLERELFHCLHDESGHKYDPAFYSLLQTDNGGLFIVPRDAKSSASAVAAAAMEPYGSTVKAHHEKSDRKRKSKKE